MNESRRAVLGAVPLVAAVGLLAACSRSATPMATDPSAPADGEADGSVLAPFRGRDAREVIDELESTPVSDRSRDFLAQVQHDQLLLTDVATEEALALSLPEGMFYVSVAPYAAQTHDCFLHSLTTCRGEMASEELTVTVEAADGAAPSGELPSGEKVTTHDNGFFGLWLPAGMQKATLRIEHGASGRSAELPISTMPDSPTCVTTAQLEG